MRWLVFRVILPANLTLGVRHLAMSYPALYRVLPWVLHQVSDHILYCFDYLRDACIFLVFPYALVKLLWFLLFAMTCQLKLKRSTMLCINSDGDFCVAFHDCSSFVLVVVSDHFSNGKMLWQLFLQQNAISWHCAEEKAQIPEPVLSCKCCRRTVHVTSLVCVHRLLDSLQD